MAYTAWSVTAGEVPTSTKWNILGTNDAGFNDGTNIVAGAINNTHIAANALLASKFFIPYKFLCYRSAAESVTNTGRILFDTKIFDTGSNLDVVTNQGRFTAPVAGFYRFSGAYTVNPAGSTIYRAGLYKNGTEYIGGSQITTPSAATTSMYDITSPSIQLAASDYVELFLQTGYVGGIQTLVVGQLNCWFGGEIASST